MKEIIKKIALAYTLMTGMLIVMDRIHSWVINSYLNSDGTIIIQYFIMAMSFIGPIIVFLYSLTILNKSKLASWFTISSGFVTLALTIMLIVGYHYLRAILYFGWWRIWRYW